MFVDACANVRERTDVVLAQDAYHKRGRGTTMMKYLLPSSARRSGYAGRQLEGACRVRIELYNDLSRFLRAAPV